ncbi:hypothetical protein BV20DRAFT_965664 [Pilatotrama ljubarskyi]|nr:hypothetical protein BV20DRAFT_965664 [Pilatotrama ljubarskyi]
MPEQLPPEILDRILDFLHDDRRTLSACALAGRVLLPTARFHRFDNVKLFPGQVQTLISLVDSTPELARAITTLRIHPVQLDPSLRGHLVLDLLSRLPTLSALQIPASLSKLFPGETLRGVLASHVPSLTSLSLYGYPSQISPAEFLHTISALPLLEDITLLHIKMPSVSDAEDVPYSLPPPPRLHHIKSRRSDGVSLIGRWLQAHPSSCGLRSWDELITEPEDAKRFSEVSAICGGTLKDLQVKFIPLGRMAAALREADEFTLSRFSALETCTLRFAFGEMCVAANQSLAEIPALVSQLTASSLRILTVALVVDNIEDLRSLNSECAVRKLSPAYFDDMRVLDWSSIERTLTRERLGALRKFVLEGQGSSQLLEKYIQTTCPELHARRIVSLVAADTKDAWWPRS